MIELCDVRKKYRHTSVLDGVSLKTEEGRGIGILGANGSGKSTLLSILSGVLRADAGTFLANGTDLLQNHNLRKQLVGYVPQGNPLFEELTAKDNLRMWYKKNDMERELQEGVLGMLGISEFLRVPVGKISGGMKKRLAIGCAMAQKPQILLLDEPSAALDLIAKERIYQYLSDFKQRGGTVFLATHDVNELELCDCCYILKNGTLTSYEYDGNVHQLAGRL